MIFEYIARCLLWAFLYFFMFKIRELCFYQGDFWIQQGLNACSFLLYLLSIKFLPKLFFDVIGGFFAGSKNASK